MKNKHTRVSGGTTMLLEALAGAEEGHFGKLCFHVHVLSI